MWLQPSRVSFQAAMWHHVQLLFGAAALASDACLDDALAAHQLQNITSAYGSHPLGVWIIDHPAGRVTASLVQIILQEALGYHTEHLGLRDAP